MHGGRIEAQSEGIGRGARFTVWLRLDKVAAPPAVKPEDMARERKMSAQEAHPPLPPPDGKLAGMRVLVVDDTPENAESLGALLSLEGALVRIAMSAEEALLISEQRDFDCVVSDIAMPNMDGHALLTELRKRPRTKRTPAIALTGYDRAADAAKAKDAGFDEHVAKPADIEELVQMILRLGIAKIRSS
jgi:two-component system CheB/CheR fusion protein